MTADEAKSALCAHLGIGAHHEWAYIVGYVEGRIIPAPSAPQRAPRHEQRCPECNCDQSGIKYEDWRNDPYCDGCSLENGVEGFD